MCTVRILISSQLIDLDIVLFVSFPFEHTNTESYMKAKSI